MIATPLRAWTAPVAAAVVAHAVLVLVPVMDASEGAAAAPPVVHVRLRAARAEIAAEPAPSASEPALRDAPTRERPEPSEPPPSASRPAETRAGGLTTEPAEAIPPAPTPRPTRSPSTLPDGLITEPPAAPNAASAVDAEQARALDAYAALIRHEVEEHKRYPRRARKLQRQGVAHVDLVLTRDGRLAAAPTLTRSSGWDSLDREALRMARAAAPFPRAPAAITAPTIAIRLPIRFSID